MGKSFKDGIVYVLLTIVIVLLLAIALYEYSPNQKSLSKVEAYKREEETSTVLKEINSASVAGNDEESIITSYAVTSSDLSTYARTNTYNQGRSNPFAAVNDQSKSSGNNDNGNGKTTSTTKSTKGKTSNSSSSTSESTGYFKSTGTNK